MKKHLLYLFCILLVAFASYAFHLHGSGVAGGADYCSGVSWNTFTDFYLDFDHTTDEKTACGANETGAFTNATTTTPASVSPLSGGKAILGDGDAHYITFGNSGGYFSSTYGGYMFCFKVASDNTNTHGIFNITEVAYQDRLEFSHNSNGTFGIQWEDNNGGTIAVNSTEDTDAHDDRWVNVHVIWDTTRCTDGDGNCADAGEDELCLRSRIDDNSDGDFLDGGAEDWSAWTCETSDVDLEAWSAEPGAGDILLGIINGTQVETYHFDDLEISNSQPSWP